MNFDEFVGLCNCQRYIDFTPRSSLCLFLVNSLYRAPQFLE